MQAQRFVGDESSMQADKYQDYMYNLVKRVIDEIGPRPACSEAERKLGRLLADEWRPVCDRVDTESFTCRPGAFLGFIPLSVLLYFASVVLYWFYPFAAFVLAALGLSMVAFEFVRYREFVDFLFRREQGENVVGTIRPRGEARRRVIVSAHQDSAYEFRLWRLFGNAAIPLMGLAILGMLTAFAGSLAKTIAYLGGLDDATAFMVLGIVMAAFSPVVAPFIFFLSDRSVPGAMDDMAGIAVVAAVGKFLGDTKSSGGFYPENTEVVLLATSSEEAGLRGAKRYVKKHMAELMATPTYAIFVEETADERYLTAATAELCTGARHDRGLVEMARKVAAGHGWPIALKPIPLGASDASAFSKRGVPSTCLFSQDSTRLVPNYHTRDDTLEHVRPEALSVTLQMVIEMIQEIDSA
ncbi:MAG: M28 family peptidase [Dehalococcoidia bacterium]|nr:M28 family peptidase [Dehalococcoidia bacterium]